MRIQHLCALCALRTINTLNHWSREKILHDQIDKKETEKHTNSDNNIELRQIKNVVDENEWKKADDDEAISIHISVRTG